MTGTIFDAYGQRKQQRVMKETWGEPQDGAHPGHIIFGHGTYGSGTFILETKFDQDADGHPGPYAVIWDFVNNKAQEGQIMRFDGELRVRTRRDGEKSYRLVGRVTRCTIIHAKK